MSDTALEQRDDDQQRLFDQGMLRRACLFVLGNGFDTVQIIATRHEAEVGTVHCSWGEGNYYARKGSMAEWLKVQDDEE